MSQTRRRTLTPKNLYEARGTNSVALIQLAPHGPALWAGSYWNICRSTAKCCQ